MGVARSEVVGQQFLRILEIDVTDPSGTHTSSGWWTANKTLYLTDHPHIRNSTSTTDPEYWRAVMEWGDLWQRGQIGSGLATLADTSVTLKNIKITPQEVTPAGASGGMTLSPSPDFADLKLSDLMRWYEWQNATVRIKLLLFPLANRDQNTATYSTIAIFEGLVADARVDGDSIFLDLIENVKALRAPLPGRELTNPIFQEGTVRLPVVYGELWTLASERRTSESLAAEYWTQGESILLGEKPALVPAVAYGRHATTKTNYRYCWNDCKGPNSGWGDQPDWNPGPYPSSDDVVLVYNQDTDTLTMLQNHGEGQPVSGEYAFEDGATANEQLTLLVADYLAGWTYFPAVSVLASSGFTDAEKALNRKPNTVGLLSLSANTKYVDFRVAPSSALGNVVLATDSIVGWLGFANSYALAGTRVTWGLYEVGTGYIGTPAIMSPADMSGSWGTKRQTFGFLTPGTISKATLFAGTSRLPNWNWEINQNEVVLRVACSVAGDASSILEISSGGIAVKHDLREQYTDLNAQITYDLYKNIRWGPGARQFGPPSIINAKGQNPATKKARIWVQPAKASLDDASGTLTGTAEKNIASPAHIVAHLLAKWGKGIAAANLNLVATGTTDSTAFGSFRHAAADLDAWLDDVTGASAESWVARIVIDEATTVADAVDAVCKEAPMMITRDNSDGKYRAIVYPAGTPATRHQFADSGSNEVTFHPNIRPDASKYGRPYSVSDIRFEYTSIDEMANDFILRYKRFDPSGQFAETVNVNGDGYRVWTATDEEFDIAGDTLGDALKTACAASETRYGVRQSMTIESATIHRNAVATAYLDYLVTRFSKRRLIVTARAHLEAYDLRPGHVVRFADECNQLITVPEYGMGDWTDAYFLVLDVTTIPSPDGFAVQFKAERLY